jgi:hypothetical protein
MRTEWKLTLLFPLHTPFLVPPRPSQMRCIAAGGDSRHHNASCKRGPTPPSVQIAPPTSGYTAAPVGQATHLAATMGAPLPAVAAVPAAMPGTYACAQWLT